MKFRFRCTYYVGLNIIRAGHIKNSEIMIEQKKLMYFEYFLGPMEIENSVKF